MSLCPRASHTYTHKHPCVCACMRAQTHTHTQKARERVWSADVVRGECINSSSIIYHCVEAVVSLVSQVAAASRSSLSSVIALLTAAIIYNPPHCYSVIRKPLSCYKSLQLEHIWITEKNTGQSLRFALLTCKPFWFVILKDAHTMKMEYWKCFGEIAHVGKGF